MIGVVPNTYTLFDLKAMYNAVLCVDVDGR